MALVNGVVTRGGGFDGSGPARQGRRAAILTVGGDVQLGPAVPRGPKGRVERLGGPGWDAEPHLTWPDVMAQEQA